MRSSRGRSIENNPLRGEDWTLLKEVCGEDEAFFDLQVRLLGIEQSHRGMSRRAGIFEKLERRFRAGDLWHRAGGRGGPDRARAAEGGSEGAGEARDVPYRRGRWRSSSGC